jgi:excinuclease ABC subunit B
MFDLKAPFVPKGDQIEAIETLRNNFKKGLNEQVLLDFDTRA